MGKSIKKSASAPFKSKKPKTAMVKSAAANSDKQNIKTLFPVVGIGASAGGLEAIEGFFKSLPGESSAAFVVIQHLDPTRKGILPDLIQRYTLMEVLQACDNMKVLPNHVYIIPPNKYISISKGRLFLSDPVETRGLRLPIDFFFNSLAVEIQEQSIGIILSGMGSDGSMGVRAIKEKSGLVMVQAPETSKFDSMPESAIKAVTVDIVDSPENLSVRLNSYLKNKHVIKPIADLPAKDRSSLEKIIILLGTQTGHDFSQYKNNTLYRRIERRMGICQISKIADYAAYLKENNQEIETLFKEFLIGVTQFFRDERVWEELKEKILPEIFVKLDDGCTYRAWVAGCSTGEEAYSLAIIFKEVLEKLSPAKGIKFQIFATDLDNKAIETARAGIYTDSIIANVEPKRLKRFFSKTESGSYRVNTLIREMIVFAPHNITRDPPFTKLDFISCRNMLIYMETGLQVKLLRLVSYCLNPEGIFILGTSESTGIQNSLFITVDGKLKIYKRPSIVNFEGMIDFPSSFSHKQPGKTKMTTSTKIPETIDVLANQLLLQQFAPAGVITNEKGDIIYVTGPTGDYLAPAVGKANMNIFTMAREGLKNEISMGFHKAMKSYNQVVLRNVMVGAKGTNQYIDITIQKIEKPEALLGMYMVFFSVVPEAIEPASASAKRKRSSSNTNLKNLAAELQSTKVELKYLMEDRQTSLEELNSTNEELQSSNEELQSTNEELTTSKEEMQSLNEELQSVNIELQSKIEDYIHINNDLKNLFDSTDIATLFLDKELNVRRYTKEVTTILKLIVSDIGRPFTDIVSDLDYPDISLDAREVLDTLIPIEKEIRTLNERWFNVRIMPYRTLDDRIDGLVITFSNITQAKKLEFELKKANKELMNSENKYKNLFHEKELLLKEVHHRIKNNMNTIFSILKLQAEGEDNVHSKNVLEDSASRIRSMMILYDKLYHTENNYDVDLKEYFPIFIKEIASIFPPLASVNIDVQLESLALNVRLFSNIGLIINELITNSMKYAFNGRDDGEIRIAAISNGKHITIIYQDNGPGLPENLSKEISTGFGMFLLDTLVNQINGTIKIERECAKFIIEFEINN